MDISTWGSAERAVVFWMVAALLALIPITLLLQSSFEFKVMANAGYELNTVFCSGCGKTDAVNCSYFSISAGGLVCDSCRSEKVADTGRLVKLSPEGIRLIMLVSTGEPEEWPDAVKENSAEKEIRFLLDKVLEHWMERDFKSRRVLKNIPGI